MHAGWLYSQNKSPSILAEHMKLEHSFTDPQSDLSSKSCKLCGNEPVSDGHLFHRSRDEVDAGQASKALAPFGSLGKSLKDGC